LSSRSARFVAVSIRPSPSGRSSKRPGHRSKRRFPDHGTPPDVDGFAFTLITRPATHALQIISTRPTRPKWCHPPFSFERAAPPICRASPPNPHPALGDFAEAAFRGNERRSLLIASAECHPRLRPSGCGCLGALPSGGSIRSHRSSDGLSWFHLPFGGLFPNLRPSDGCRRRGGRHQ
jgi:hypothetical protein